MARAPESQRKLQRSVRRAHLYHYAKSLGCSPGLAREMSHAAWRLLAAFPEHDFPSHIRDYAKMGKKPCPESASNLSPGAQHPPPGAVI